MIPLGLVAIDSVPRPCIPPATLRRKPNTQNPRAWAHQVRAGVGNPYEREAGTMKDEGAGTMSTHGARPIQRSAFTVPRSKSAPSAHLITFRALSARSIAHPATLRGLTDWHHAPRRT
jgi:hypothetical protein